LETNREIFERYTLQKGAYLKDNNYHSFLQNLRNYSSHNSYIKIGSEFSYNIEWPEPRKSIYVNKTEILKWDGWSKQSKLFIQPQEEKIRLNEILRTHFGDFILFQNWIYLQIFLVDKKQTESFLFELNTIYEKASQVNMKYYLVFKTSYLRYIAYVYGKALSTE
jgi:hypothetical protein